MRGVTFKNMKIPTLQDCLEIKQKYLDKKITAEETSAWAFDKMQKWSEADLGEVVWAELSSLEILDIFEDVVE